MLTAGEVAEVCPRGHGDGARDTAQALAGVDHWSEPPGLSLGVQVLRTTRKTGAVCGDRVHVGLHDALRGRGRPDACAAPSEVRRAPGGLARRADIVAQEQRFAPQRGCLESTEGLCTSPAQGPHGCILHRWDRARRQVTRAQESGPLARIPTLGCDPVAGLLGPQ